jgi:CBS domain-containing protein
VTEFDSEFQLIKFIAMCTIRELLTEKGSEVISISPNAVVHEAVELLASKDIGALVVVDNKKIVGLFSERDYTRSIAISGIETDNMLVKELMSKQVFYIHPEKSIKDGLLLMTAKRIRHVPVVEEGKLLGIVSIGDIANRIIMEQDAAIEDLEGILYGGYGVHHGGDVYHE